MVNKKTKKVIIQWQKGQYIKGSIPVVTFMCPTLDHPKYRNQKLTGLKGEISSNTIIVGDLITYSANKIDHQTESQ